MSPPQTSEGFPDPSSATKPSIAIASPAVSTGFELPLVFKWVGATKEGRGDSPVPLETDGAEGKVIWARDRVDSMDSSRAVMTRSLRARMSVALE